MKKQFEVSCFGTTYSVVIVKREYPGGNLALQVLNWDDEFQDYEPFGVLTVNIPGQPLLPGFAFLKNYSENAEWAEALAKAIGGRPTGKSVRTGFVTVPLWDFRKINI